MATAWVDLHRWEPALARDLAARVRRGAVLLDRVEPGWHLRVAGDRLAMETCDRCILGQLYGDYLKGFRMVTGPLPSHRLFSAADHGFTLRFAEQDLDQRDDRVLGRFAALADLWRAEVLAREGAK
jgi:hypothetical protein